MNVLQHTRNELNLCLKQNRQDRSYRDTLLSVLKGYKLLKWLVKHFDQIDSHMHTLLATAAWEIAINKSIQ